VAEALPLDALIGKLFIERRDVKPYQKQDGTYDWINQRFTRTDIQDHLSGKRTYGHYLIDPATQNCRIFCFDIDLNKECRVEFRSKDTERIAWLTAELRCFASGLAQKVQEILDIPTAQLFSGSKGVHVYGFTGSEKAKTVREAAYSVMEAWDKTCKPQRGDNFFVHPSYPELEIEIFPKQDTVDEEHFGNLLRLPLGIHRKTGNQSFFIDTTAALWDLVPADPMGILGGT
jgi:hypothetical protein